jgi:Ca2+-binding RTX toxin-like protein
VNLVGTSGDDILAGGPENDLIEGGEGADVLHGGAGDDTLYERSPQLQDLVTDRLFGDDGDDALYGHHNDRLDGGAGNDTLTASTDSAIWGGAGDDHIIAQSALGEAGGLLLDGGLGNDLIEVNGYPTIQFGVQNNNASALVTTGGGVDEISFYASAMIVTDFGADDRLTLQKPNTFFVTPVSTFSVSTVGGDSFLFYDSQLPYGYGGSIGIWLGGYAGNLSGQVSDSIALTPGETNAGQVGGTSADHLVGGTGVDRLDGGAGDDILQGGAGADHLIGGTGDDTFLLPDSYDWLEGGAGRDTIDWSGATNGVNFVISDDIGSAGHFTATGVEAAIGGAFDDVLSAHSAVTVGFDFAGEAGDDHLTGGDGVDRLDGGDGYDILYSGKGADILTGGALADGFGFLQGDSVSGALDVITDFETGVDTIGLGNVASVAIVRGDNSSLIFVDYGSGPQSVIDVPDIVQGSDLRMLSLSGGGVGLDIVGADVGETLIGGGYGDRLFGNGGADVLAGGLGGDVLDGGVGFDYASYAGAATGVTVFLGGPHLNAGEAVGDSYTAIEGVIGSAYADLVGGTNGGDALRGGDGNDWLLGIGGDDWLVGGTGSDLLQGGLGHDVMDGGTGDDVASYREAAAGVTAYMNNYLANAGEAFGDQYAAIENLWGSDFADTLGGTDAAGQVYGFGGTDTLYGYGGDDNLYGGDATDTLSGGTGANTFFFLLQNEGGDVITDFVSGQDRVFFSEYWFGLPIAPAGAIDPSRFVSGDHPVATAAGASFLFDTTSHQLLFDPDGSGAQAAILMATFGNGVNLTAGDIWAA